MKKLCFLITFALSFNFLYAQITVKGTLTDSVENKKLTNSVISILRKSDSSLIKFTRADADGNFMLKDLKDDSLILMITHPYFGDYFDNIVTKGTSIDLGKIYMVPKTKLLAEVIVRSGAPIRIKGDTTVYTADSFKVRPGANVEELLRRLPGIQVDRDGKITAMGERVKKVLVDGEEFFGSDPGIATKNLRADQVQEVQVFDKKSDQAEFTGIDDGVKDKTINLKMKKLNGYFGKIEAGGGLPDKYNNDAMVNSFSGKRKVAAYGIMSNTGQTNLDWDDAQNYGGGEIEGMTTEITDDGGVSISFNGGGEDSYWGGRNGIPQNWNAGLHYSNKFHNDKLSFNSGYKFSKVNADIGVTTHSENFSPDTSWTNLSQNNGFSSINKHAFNVTVESNIDSMNSIKWVTKVNNNNADNSSHYYSEAVSDGKFINNSYRNTANNTDKNNITSSFLWKHKFKKTFRTFSINSDVNWTEVKNNGLLQAINSYYYGGVLNHVDTIDQQNIQNSGGNSISTRFLYTEPIVKDVTLALNYTIGVYHNSNDRLTYEKSSAGKYEEIVDSLSNSFVFNKLVQTPGATININKKKNILSFGINASFTNYSQHDKTKLTTTNYNYHNFYPSINYTHKFKSNENLRINYTGMTTPPSLEQLQPVRVNTDPLNIYIGNQNLKEAFRHNLNLNYNFYNVLKERNLWSSVSASTTENAFVQSSYIDSFGKRTYQTVNTNGIYSFGLWSQYGFKIKGSKFRFSAGPSMYLSRNIDFINGDKNITNTNNYGMRLNINRYAEKKFDFNLGPNISWNHSKASINKSADVDYWQIDGWASFNYYLPKNFQLGSDANVQFREKDKRFSQNMNYTTWNASLIKRMLKDNKLELKMEVHDILDQNRGYQRNFSSYSFTETYYKTLRRYWLFTITWNISKNGKPPGSGF